MKSVNNTNFIVATLLIIGGAFSRLITVLPNFSVLESVALFSGAILVSKYRAILIPLVMMYFSDLIINNTVARQYFAQEGFIWFSKYMIWNIISIIGIVILGSYILKKVTVGRFIGGVLGATLVFFLISNFGHWISTTTYPKNLTGLGACYVAGIPFLKNSLLGNFFFASILFGSYALIMQYLKNSYSQNTEKA